MDEKDSFLTKTSGDSPVTAGAVYSLKTLLLPVFEKYPDRIVFVYLFGSAAKDEVTPLSDVDVAVFLSEGTREFYSDTRLSLYADLCRKLNRNDVDLVVLNTAHNIILLEEIVRYGAVLYDNDVDAPEDFEIKVIHRTIDFREQRFAVMGV